MAHMRGQRRHPRILHRELLSGRADTLDPQTLAVWAAEALRWSAYLSLLSHFDDSLVARLRKSTAVQLFLRCERSMPDARRAG